MPGKLPSLILVFLMIAATTRESRACECYSFGADPEKLLAGFEVAFLGEVVVGNRPEDAVYTGHFVLRVTDVWQGDVHSSQRVVTGAGDCAIGLVEGQTYLIFANREPEDSLYGGELFVHQCSPIFTLAEADALLEELGPGEAPLSSTCGLSGVLPFFLLFSALVGLRINRVSLVAPPGALAVPQPERKC